MDRLWMYFGADLANGLDDGVRKILKNEIRQR